MTRLDQKALSEIEALMHERQKFEKWISALGERRSITPSHVFQRVLSDYEERMRVVSAELAGRATEIQASISHLVDRLSEVQHEEDTTVDQRSEAELRAAVGEFTPEKWEEIRASADENISRLSALRMELSGELDHLRSILVVASPGAAAEEPRRPAMMQGSDGSRGGGPREPVSPVTDQRGPARPVSPIAVSAQRPQKEEGFDELAFLSSVVESEISQLAAPPADVPRSQAPSAEPSVERARPEPASGGGKFGRSATPLIAESIQGGDEAGDTATRLAEDAARPQVDRRLSGSVPAYLKDVPKEMSKSLKCQECGTMNYPTEWYCERCGGELAAL
jgi:hypothetical protein